METRVAGRRPLFFRIVPAARLIVIRPCSNIRPVDDSLDYSPRFVRLMTSQMKKSPTSPADNVIALYQEHARAFAQQRSRDLFERGWLTRFLALLPASGKPRVLDIGCGNGVPIARHLIEQGCEITGVDTSLPLLAGAQAAFPDHRWIAADMRRMPLNETFHGLIARHSLFHLRPEEQRPLFATFARLAAPGAPLMFTSGTTLGKRSGNSKDSRCITAAWTARSIATCWKPTGLKWCDMSSGMRSAAARMSGWPGVAAPSMARRVSRASRQSRAGSVAVDEVLRIPDEPGKIQPFSLAGLDGQAPVRGSRCIVRALRGGRWPAAVVHVGAPGRRVGAGGERCGCDCDKDGAQCLA